VYHKEWPFRRIHIFRLSFMLDSSSFFLKDSSFQVLQEYIYSLFQIISVVIWQALQLLGPIRTTFQTPKRRIFNEKASKFK